MKRVVLGIVDTPAQADITVRQLVAVGLPPNQVSVLYPDRHGDHDFAFEAHTKAPEGALLGIGLGAVIGATVGLALGLAGKIPELALLVEAGPVLAALAGAAIGGFVLGLVGALCGVAVPEIEARHYDGKSRIGTILIGVHAGTREDVRRAREVLRNVAASDVHTTTEAPLPISS